MGASHALKNFLVRGIYGQIVNLMRIGLGVIQFFNRFAVREILGGDASKFTFLEKTSHLGHRRPFFRRVHVLVVSLQGLIVSQVFELLITNHTDDVVTLIHSIASTKDILSWLGALRSQKRSTLHRLWSFNASKVQDGSGKVN